MNPPLTQDTDFGDGFGDDVADAFGNAVGDTHEVLNQAEPIGDYDPWARDLALQEAVERYDALWAAPQIQELAVLAGRADIRRLGDLANRHTPELQTHDRFGRRIDQVSFHPAWHQLMRIGVEAEIHSLPWRKSSSRSGPSGAHLARIAKHYLFSQTEAGIHCPLTMTFASVPALQHEPSLAETWIPRITRNVYDPRPIPAQDKDGVLIGMAMTEKQGGSDVRANTTRALKQRDGSYKLLGHKWFCSAPMCDAFLTLAQTEAGLTCFLVPRLRPDGTHANLHNGIHIQRLKDKLGNRSNASSEIEYRGSMAWRVGAEGRGIATILDMVAHTRLDCVSGSAAMMRRALTQALHHTTHRHAFGKPLREQPLMRSVLADLALESEAATVLMARLAASYDRAQAGDDVAKAFGRIATAVGKYWVCKRGIAMVGEAMECLGGNGYVEEAIMPRLYREMPVNSTWEGSGNVMCLDVLRALGRNPETADALLAELDAAQGLDSRYDQSLARLKSLMARMHTSPDSAQAVARFLVEQTALLLQAGLLLRHSPDFVAEAFLSARLTPNRGLCFGALDPEHLPDPSSIENLLQRAWPAP